MRDKLVIIIPEKNKRWWVPLHGLDGILDILTEYEQDGVEPADGAYFEPYKVDGGKVLFQCRKPDTETTNDAWARITNPGDILSRDFLYYARIRARKLKKIAGFYR